MRRAKQRQPGTAGLLRVEARTTRLAPKLQRGDIAVLDQVDLDGATAQTLVARGVAAVVNAAPSTSGRYPNLGPQVLVSAGIPLLDGVGPGVLTALKDGHPGRVDGDALWVDDTEVARGTRQDVTTVAAATELARAGVAAQLADLAGGTVSFLLEERGLLLEGVGLPPLRTPLRGRHVLLVGPAYGGAADLARLRRYRRRHQPVLVGVDGGGDVLLAAKLPVDLLVGDPGTMSEAALRAASEVVLRAEVEGLERVHDLAVPVLSCATRAASEDLALLLVLHEGCALVVAAGVPRSLEELLDRGRLAASSSLVTRVAAGSRLLPAEAAVLLTPGRRWRLGGLCVVLAALLVGSVAVDHVALLDAWNSLGR